MAWTDTEDEKDKFFDDAMTLATNMTDGQTFADVLPLMNFWAGFTPSAEVRCSHSFGNLTILWI